MSSTNPNRVTWHPKKRVHKVPPQVRRVALGILSRVAIGGGNSSQLLDDARVRNAADRGLLTELVLGVLRHQIALDYVLAPVVNRDLEKVDTGVRVALRLGLYQLNYLDRVPNHAAVKETVEAVKGEVGHAAAGFVNGVLRSVLRKGSRPLPGPEKLDDYLAITLSLPSWLAGRWRGRFGDDAVRSLAEAAVRPPRVHLRVIGGASEVPRITGLLEDEGLVVESGLYLDDAIVIRKGSPVGSVPLQSGLVIAQDEAAQIVSRLIASDKPMRYLDVCSAPGGKAITVADTARDGSRIVAVDRSLARLRRMRRNFERTGMQIESFVCDSQVPGWRGLFDRILVDAPCTGTGTIRRNPETRYRVGDERLARSRERGRALALAAVGSLEVGGRMVYSTCSLEPEENEEVVSWLLEQRSNLRLVDPKLLLDDRTGKLVGDDGFLRTQPGETELDGLVAAVIERTS